MSDHKVKERTLLIVDDEINILSSLKRLLRKDGYRILQASSGSEGLELLKNNDVGVIVSDQRMPGMTGVEFLNEVKGLYPNTVRMVLSGYSDIQSIIDAINKGAIYRFLSKPWDDQLLRSNINEAFTNYELVAENEQLKQELLTANAQLAAANIELAKRVEEKSRDADFNLRSLQVAQDILENLPVAVLGIGDDGMVAIANLNAHNFLSNQDGGLVGRQVSDVLPRPIVEQYYSYRESKKVTESYISMDSGSIMDLLISPLGQESFSASAVLVLIQRKGSSE